jgi:polysaccharide export outer membrane protein
MNKKNNAIFLFFLFFAGCSSPVIDVRHFSDPPKDLPVPADYLIGIGDALEIMYYIDPGSSQMEYLIDTEDVLRIEFYYYPTLNKTVKVRPDGFITLQRVGDVVAVGMTPKELSLKLKKLFEPLFVRPDVTVEVTDFNVKVKNLKEAVQTTTRGESKEAVVRPDGKISLPYIRDVSAKDITCKELSNILEEKYRRIVKNISITVSILSARSNRAYIMGEIARPNFYELIGPISLTQLISNAGGFSTHANTHQVLLIRRNKNGYPDARLIDMNNIIGRGDMTSDPIIRQYDVVFVPRTQLSQAALVMESILNLIPVNFSASYSLGGKTTK